MGRTAFVLLGVLAASSAQGQLEIRHDSEVNYAYQYIPPGSTDPTTVSDSNLMSSVTGVGVLLPTQQHSISYVHPGLGYDPNSSSSYSIDGFEVLADSAQGYLVKYNLSGSVYRHAPGIHGITPDPNVGPGEAEAYQNIRIELDRFGSGDGIAFFQYSLAASFTTDNPGGGFGANVFEMDAVMLDGTIMPLEELQPGAQQTQTDFFTPSTGVPAQVDYIDIRVSSQHLAILIEKQGENQFDYQLEFLTIVQEIPAPSTAALPAMAGLLLSRRRRG